MQSSGCRGAAVLACCFQALPSLWGCPSPPLSADGTTPPPSTGATSLGAFPSNYPVCDDGINESDPLNLGTDDRQCDLPGPSELNSSQPLATIIGQLYYPNGSPVYQPFEVPTLRSCGVTQPAATAAGSRITARRCSIFRPFRVTLAQAAAGSQMGRPRRLPGCRERGPGRLSLPIDRRCRGVHRSARRGR